MVEASTSLVCVCAPWVSMYASLYAGNKCTMDVCQKGKCVAGVKKLCPVLSAPAPTWTSQCLQYTCKPWPDAGLGRRHGCMHACSLRPALLRDTVRVHHTAHLACAVCRMHLLLTLLPPSLSSRCADSNTCEPKTGSCVPATKVAKKADGTHCPLAAPGDRCRDAVCRNGLCANITVTTCPPYKPPAVTRDNQCKAFTGVCVSSTHGRGGAGWTVTQ